MIGVEKEVLVFLDDLVGLEHDIQLFEILWFNVKFVALFLSSAEKA
jgi:hypothetical protein